MRRFLSAVSAVWALAFLALVGLASCEAGPERDANFHMFPYLRFIPNAAGDACVCRVVPGARVRSLYIPAAVEVDGKVLPVIGFDGFANPADAADLLWIELESGRTRLADNCLDEAKGFEGFYCADPDVWAHLPAIGGSAAGRFLGWFGGSDEVVNGLPADKSQPWVKPMFAEAVDPCLAGQCVPSGSYERSETGHRPLCSVCGRPIGGFAPHDSAVIAYDSGGHWRECSVCGARMTGKEPHDWKTCGGEIRCSVCGCRLADGLSIGCFSAVLETGLPEGEVVVTNVGTRFTCVYSDKPDAPPSQPPYQWYLDGKRQAGTSDTFVFEAPLPRFYTVRCVFSNDGGTASIERRALGGSRARVL